MTQPYAILSLTDLSLVRLDTADDVKAAVSYATKKGMPILVLRYRDRGSQTCWSVQNVHYME